MITARIFVESQWGQEEASVPSCTFSLLLFQRHREVCGEVLPLLLQPSTTRSPRQFNQCGWICAVSELSYQSRWVQGTFQRHGCLMAAFEMSSSIPPGLLQLFLWILHSASPRGALAALAHRPLEADLYIWGQFGPAYQKWFAFHQRCHRSDSSGGCRSCGGWRLPGERSEITGHPALCAPMDCHTSRRRLPGWKGWASLVATEGEFLLPALLLVTHRPCSPTSGTPLVPPWADSAH